MTILINNGKRYNIQKPVSILNVANIENVY